MAPSCSRRAAPALVRDAFLNFDNLTGDASLDWIGQAAPQILAHDLTGVPKFVPVAVATVRDAYLDHASRMIHGYYELRSGHLHFELMVEDAASHQALATAAEDGPPAVALNRAAKNLASEAHTFDGPESAVDAWGRGDFEHAVMLDPSFAQAWVSWAQQLVSMGDKARALDVVQRALAQPKLDSPIDKARLELAMGTLRNDDAQRLQASRTLASLIPYDPSLLAAVADLDMATRNFTAAAKDYQLTHQANPSDAAALNLLGYAQALAGDLDAARKSFAEYGRGPGDDAVNAIDSLGEALFINGKFDDAQSQFEDAYRKDPKFLDGETIWKAAHACWLAAPQDRANLAAADKIADAFFAGRAAAQDPLLDWRRAFWLYETGRRQQAMDLLNRASASNPIMAALAKQQLQLWNSPLPSSPLETLKAAYLHSDPVNDGLPRTLYAAALLKAGQKNDARELLQRWPLPPRGESPLESLMYPEYLDLRKQLQLAPPASEFF
jgi:TolA-binding protein